MATQASLIIMKVPLHWPMDNVLQQSALMGHHTHVLDRWVNPATRLSSHDLCRFVDIHTDYNHNKNCAARTCRKIWWVWFGI